MIESLIHSMVVCPDIDKNYPRITYGKGVYLYDESGKKYLDASSGSAAVANIGHGIEGISKIIAEQVSKVAILPTHAFSAEIVEKYMKKLVQFAPKGFKRAWTVMSGTEAVENALKMALQYHQLIGNNNRHKIVSRWYSYHGNSIFTLDVGGMKYRRQMYDQWMHSFPHVSPAYQYRHDGKLTEEEYCDFCVEEFKKTIIKNDPDTIAAFIAEPVVGAALGAVTPPKNYFSRIKEICENHGILFISDEVMTGFGRLGTNFGIEQFETTPDIIAAGKGISGGYFPLSAILINEKIASVFEKNQVLFKAGHTFACNPIGAAVGNFVIDYIEENNILENVEKAGNQLKKRLDVLKTFPIVGDVRGKGLLLGIEFVKNKENKIPFPAEMTVSKKIYKNALEKGVVLYPGKGSLDGILGDHMLICPPLTISSEEVNFLADTLIKAVSEVQLEIGY